MEGVHRDSHILCIQHYLPCGVLLPSLVFVSMCVIADDTIAVTVTDTNRVITHVIAIAAPMGKESTFK